MLGGVDPVTGIGHMLALPFEARAYVAGTLISVAAGLVGYFLVLRSQVFTGDALSHVAFTGALAALAAGIDLRVGLFAACVVVAVAIAVIGRGGRADDVVVGNVFAWILGLGALLLTVYTTSTGAGDGGAGVNVLFGSIFGLTSGQTTVAALVAAGVVVVVAVVARPLLFASVDPAVAAARGVPVRLLGIGFLALVGVTAGEATQAVGSLLLLGLLATPAATALRVTSRPWAALALSAGVATGAMWVGLALAYAFPVLPPSFAIMAVATSAYLAVLALTSRPDRRSQVGRDGRRGRREPGARTPLRRSSRA